jgi:hypothetical protein
MTGSVVQCRGEDPESTGDAPEKTAALSDSDLFGSFVAELFDVEARRF